MAQWGNLDQANNSPISTPAQVKVAPNTVNRDSLYGNTTVDAFIPGQKIGQFAVDSTEIAVNAGNVVSISVSDPGYGYFANAAVTLSGNATANASANSTGYISAINVTAVGSAYTAPPTVTVAAPTVSFNANTDIDVANSFIAIASNGTKLTNGMLVTYTIAAGNTANIGLTSNGQYYVVGANSTGIKLSLTASGNAVALTKGATESGHNIVGKTATAAATINGGKSRGIAHTGWVLRTEGTGGRAGRVSYEVLVAGGIGSDGSDDTILPDA